MSELRDVSEGWELPPRGPVYPSPSSTSAEGVLTTMVTLLVLQATTKPSRADG